jgi:hypothetical protein
MIACPTFRHRCRVRYECRGIVGGFRQLLLVQSQGTTLHQQHPAPPPLTRAQSCKDAANLSDSIARQSDTCTGSGRLRSSVAGNGRLLHTTSEHAPQAQRVAAQPAEALLSNIPAKRSIERLEMLFAKACPPPHLSNPKPVLIHHRNCLLPLTPHPPPPPPPPMSAPLLPMAASHQLISSHLGHPPCPCHPSAALGPQMYRALLLLLLLLLLLKCPPPSLPQITLGPRPSPPPSIRHPHPPHPNCAPHIIPPSLPPIPFIILHRRPLQRSLSAAVLLGSSESTHTRFRFQTIFVN